MKINILLISFVLSLVSFQTSAQEYTLELGEVLSDNASVSFIVYADDEKIITAEHRGRSKKGKIVRYENLKPVFSTVYENPQYHSNLYYNDELFFNRITKKLSPKTINYQKIDRNNFTMVDKKISIPIKHIDKPRYASYATVELKSCENNNFFLHTNSYPMTDWKNSEISATATILDANLIKLANFSLTTDFGFTNNVRLLASAISSNGTVAMFVEEGNIISYETFDYYLIIFNSDGLIQKKQIEKLPQRKRITLTINENSDVQLIIGYVDNGINYHNATETYFVEEISYLFYDYNENEFISFIAKIPEDFLKYGFSEKDLERISYNKTYGLDFYELDAERLSDGSVIVIGLRGNYMYNYDFNIMKFSADGEYVFGRKIPASIKSQKKGGYARLVTKQDKVHLIFNHNKEFYGEEVPFGHSSICISMATIDTDGKLDLRQIHYNNGDASFLKPYTCKKISDNSIVLNLNERIGVLTVE
jgi:hypothetical protein